MAKQNPALTANWSEDAIQKFQVAKHLIAAYSAARDGLKALDIVRSERSLQSDYAEWIASKLFNLELSKNRVQKSWDGTDKIGKQYQVKSRLVQSLNDSTSFDFRTNEFAFDTMIGVFFSPTFDVIAVIEVPGEMVRTESYMNKSRWSFRWNRSVRADSRVSWTYIRDDHIAL